MDCPLHSMDCILQSSSYANELHCTIIYALMDVCVCDLECLSHPQQEEKAVKVTQIEKELRIQREKEEKERRETERLERLAREGPQQEGRHMTVVQYECAVIQTHTHIHTYQLLKAFLNKL